MIHLWVNICLFIREKLNTVYMELQVHSFLFLLGVLARQDSTGYQERYRQCYTSTRRLLHVPFLVYRMLTKRRDYLQNKARTDKFVAIITGNVSLNTVFSITCPYLDLRLHKPTGYKHPLIMW